MYYLHKDFPINIGIGNYQAITDEQGTLKEELSFDPWDRRRNPTNWTFNDVPDNYLFDRGYTGHEHLDEFVLINMNGRVYDPVIGKFLSPDPLVQLPDYSQNYNRYTYAFNNPLKYVDPSGYSSNTYLKYMMNNYDNFNYRGSYYSFDSETNSFHNSRGNVLNNGGYYYNYTTNEYKNGYGQIVPFGEVYYNYIIPNSTTIPTNGNPFTIESGKLNSKEGYWVTTSSWSPLEREFCSEFRMFCSGEVVAKFYEANSSGGLDGMDYANNTASLTGTFVGGAQYAVGAVKNQSLWTFSYKTSKALKSVGVNVQTRVIKHGVKTILANASRNIAYVGLALSATDILVDGQINASHLLNVGMVGVSAIPVFGWVAGGVYFASDMITIGVSGQSIGQHLDNYVGTPLYDF